MAAVDLPDIGALTDASDGVLGALGTIRAALPADAASVTAGLNGHTATLEASLTIDGSALTGDLAGALAALQSAVPGGLPALDELGVGLSRALGIVEPLKQALAPDGDVPDIKTFAMGKAGDPAARVQELLAGLTDLIPAEGLEALNTFVSTVTAFEAAIPTDPAQVASFIGRGFLGVPADLLGPAGDALGALLGAVGAIAPSADLAALPGRVAGLVAELGALEGHVAAIVTGDAASYDVALSAMAAFKVSLDGFTAAVETIATSVGSALQALDLDGLLAPIAAALQAVPDITIPDANAFVEIVIEPFQRVSLLLDTLSADQMAAQIRGWVTFVEEEVANQGLAELEAIIRQPFEQVGAAIAGLQLEAIRDAFRAALGTTMGALAPVTDAIATLREGVVGALDGVAPPIAALSGAVTEVQGVLQTLTGAVQTATGSVSLQGLHDEALAVIEQLSGGVTELVTTAADAVDVLQGLAGELAAIDLEDAASAVTGAIGRITDTLAGIDVAPLPDALLAELKSALNGLLDSISLAPLQATLDGVLEAVPFGALDEFIAAFEELLAELRQFSPGDLLEPLTEPFNELAATLTALQPGALLDPVVAQLQDVATTLDGFDPVALLAPLDAPLVEVRSALDAVSPERLLAPLHPPFDDLMGLVDKLDVTPFLDELDVLLGELIGQGVSGLSGLGKPFEAAGDTTSFANTISGTNPLGGDFGFHPGDVLRPVQDLYEKITGLLDSVPPGTLVAAFEQLRSGLVTTLDALSPGGLQARVQAELGGVLDGFDVSVGSGLLGDLGARYGTLSLTVGGLDPAAATGPAAAKHTALLTLTASVDPDVALRPARAALSSLRTASARAAGGLAVGTMGVQHGDVATRLSALLPDFLRAPVTIEAIHAHLDAANPKHLAAAVNAEFDAVVTKLLRFVETIVAELPKVAAAFGQRMETALSGLLRGVFAAVYDPLRAQLQALDPAGLEADLETEVYAPIRATLDSLSLAGILGDSQAAAQLAAAKAALHGVLESLQALQATVGASYEQAVAGVIAVSPATLQADLQAAYAPIAAALGEMDLGGIADELHAQFDRLADELGAVLQSVLEALQAMIDAIPGGIEGVDAQISISVGA